MIIIMKMILFSDEDIPTDLSTIKKSGEPFINSLAKVIDSVIYNPITLSVMENSQKNLLHLKHQKIQKLLQKCNYDIWAMLHSKTRSKDITGFTLIYHDPTNMI